MSTTNTTHGQLPNPYTPMAFLPPDKARLLLYDVYANIGSLGVLLWDIALHLPQDYKLLTQYRISLPIIVYCISRLSTLALALSVTIVKTTPIPDCVTAKRISMLFPLARTTALLFLFRVYALYNHNKYIIVLFSLSWLLSLGLSVQVPLSSSAIHIGITKYCVFTRTKLSTSFVIFYPLFHETLVFLATAWGLLGNSYIDVNFTNGFKVVVMGKFLPAFSKSFLYDGQAFYLADLIILLTFSVGYHVPNFPKEILALLGAPAFVLLNCLSCYIYRNVRLGVFRDYSIRTSAINKALKSAVPPLNQSTSPSNSSRRQPIETSPVQTRSTRSVDQDTGTQVGGELYELKVVHTR